METIWKRGATFMGGEWGKTREKITERFQEKRGQSKGM